MTSTQSWVPPSAPLDTIFPGVPCFDSRGGSALGCGCQLQVLMHPPHQRGVLSGGSVFGACGNLLRASSRRASPAPPLPAPPPPAPSQIVLSFPAASAAHLYTVVLLDAGVGRGASPLATRSRVHWIVANVPGTMLQKPLWEPGAFGSNDTAAAGGGGGNGRGDGDGGGDGDGVLGSQCACEATPAFGDAATAMCRAPERQRSRALCEPPGELAPWGRAQLLPPCSFNGTRGCVRREAEVVYRRFCAAQRSAAGCGLLSAVCQWSCHPMCDGASCERTLVPYVPPWGGVVTEGGSGCCRHHVQLLFRQRHALSENQTAPLPLANASSFNTARFVAQHRLVVEAANFFRVQSDEDGGGDRQQQAHVPCNIDVAVCRVRPPPLVNASKDFEWNKAGFRKGDIVSGVLGFAIGPTLFVYGGKLPAVVTLFNSLWASGLQQFLGTVSDMYCVEAFSPHSMQALYKVLIAGGVLCYAALNSPTFDRALKVGVVAEELSKGISLLLRPYAIAGAAWATAAMGFSALFAVFVSLGLVVPRAFALAVAFGVSVVMTNLGALTPSVAGLGCHHYGQDGAEVCEVEVPDACVGNAYGEFLISSVPVVVPALVVLVWELRKEKRTAARQLALKEGRDLDISVIERIDGKLTKLTPDFVTKSFHRAMKGAALDLDRPVIHRQSALIAFNTAMVSSSLLNAAFIATQGPGLRSVGLNPAQIAFPLQMLVALLGMWVQWQQENYDQKALVFPLQTTVLISAVVAVRATIVRPLAWVNTFLYILATGAVPVPLYVTEKEATAAAAAKEAAVFAADPSNFRKGTAEHKKAVKLKKRRDREERQVEAEQKKMKAGRKKRRAAREKKQVQIAKAAEKKAKADGEAEAQRLKEKEARKKARAAKREAKAKQAEKAAKKEATRAKKAAKAAAKKDNVVAIAVDVADSPNIKTTL